MIEFLSIQKIKIKKLLASSLVKDEVDLSNLDFKKLEHRNCIQVKLINEQKKIFFVPKKVLKMSYTTTHYIN